MGPPQGPHAGHVVFKNFRSYLDKQKLDSEEQRCQICHGQTVTRAQGSDSDGSHGDSLDS